MGSKNKPYPRVTTLARRLDVSPRSIQRGLNRLRAVGLISWTRVQVRNHKVVKRGMPGEGVRRRMYNLSPLVSQATHLAERRRKFREAQVQGGPPTEIAA